MEKTDQRMEKTDQKMEIKIIDGDQRLWKLEDTKTPGIGSILGEWIRGYVWEMNHCIDPSQTKTPGGVVVVYPETPCTNLRIIVYRICGTWTISVSFTCANEGLWNAPLLSPGSSVTPPDFTTR